MAIEVTVTAGPVVGPPPLLVNFSADTTGGNPPYAITWQFGDGDTSSGSSTSHTYAETGVYAAVAAVVDSDGETAAAGVSVEVTSPLPPPALVAVYPETAADTFVYKTDWKEAMDGIHQPGGGATASYSSQEATLCGYVPFNKLRSAQRYFLGFAWADDGPPYRLHREPPAPHPVFPQLRACAFSVSGFGIASQSGNPNAEPYLESSFEDQHGDSMYYGGYQFALVTVKYRSYGRMRFLPDEDIGDYTDEWLRYVTFLLSRGFRRWRSPVRASSSSPRGSRGTLEPQGNRCRSARRCPSCW